MIRKGFDLSLMSLRSRCSNGSQKPEDILRVGDDAFPGNLAINNQIKTIIKEGGKVYACRFAMAALYGHREEDMIEGVKCINPLDVLDMLIEHWREGALTIATWTV